MAVLFKTDNPIFHREVMYQQRGVMRRFRYERLLNALVLTLVLVVALLSQRGRFFPPEFWLIWEIRGLTAFRAIMAGADVISREYAEQTWEPLLLTGVSAPQIFIGKWLWLARIPSRQRPFAAIFAPRRRSIVSSIPNTSGPPPSIYRLLKRLVLAA